jgi:hypothetical protein
MGGMRSPLRVLAALLLLLLPALLLGSDKKQAPEQQANVKFTVLKDDNGKPVRNAAVVLHPVQQGGKQARGGLELKTDSDGRAGFDGIPYGMLRVQVLAPGFQTFGEDYSINQQVQELTIRLKRPQGQYSIYDKH